MDMGTRCWAGGWHSGWLTAGFSPRNLLDMDTFSKSDPVVVLYVQVSGSSEWKEFGRTEVIDNTLNPDFVRKFVLDYYFEEKQNLRFDVYNVDSKSCSALKQTGLPGSGICGTGRGDWVPAGTPGETPNGCPREAVWDHPAAGRGAEQLPGHRHDAAVRQQAG
uniref:Copine family member 9 n=1 Tax=Cyanistes caeruleus TaxID=156563 RepID=A0A8C0U5T5_CYACU